MSNFKTIINILDSTDEYLLKTDIYEFLIKFIDEMESISLNTNQLLLKLFKINYPKLKYFFLDNPDLSFKLDNNSLKDYELLILLKELIKYEQKHL